jgi:repressor LexA
LAKEFSITELPDGKADRDGLTLRQRRILQVIQDSLKARGFPPTIREICAASGLASTSSVGYQLKILEEKGYIVRDREQARAIEVRLPRSMRSRAAAAPPPADPAILQFPARNAVAVPLVGEIAAGTPILAEEQVEDTLALPKQLVGEGTLFLLRVRGDSMIGDAICDGDYVVIRQQPTANNGEIVAALIGDEATVKTFHRTKDEAWLLPSNPAYSPIDGRQATILGKVVSVLRRV